MKWPTKLFFVLVIAIVVSLVAMVSRQSLRSPRQVLEEVQAELESESFDVVINAMGNQHTPVFPDIEGIDRFAGDWWHATRWNHDVPLEGKRVVIVGSAASAVQIVPAVAQVAGELARSKGLNLRELSVVPRTVGPDRWQVEVRATVTKGFVSSRVSATWSGVARPTPREE